MFVNFIHNQLIMSINHEVLIQLYLHKNECPRKYILEMSPTSLLFATLPFIGVSTIPGESVNIDGLPNIADRCSMDRFVGGLSIVVGPGCIWLCSLVRDSRSSLRNLEKVSELKYFGGNSRSNWLEFHIGILPKLILALFALAALFVCLKPRFVDVRLSSSIPDFLSWVCIMGISICRYLSQNFFRKCCRSVK